jgi:transposase
MARFDLTDAEWAIIAPLLSGAEGRKNGRPRPDDRKVINGIFFVLRTGTPWRDLPERYGTYTTVYNRFNRWAKAGIWLRIFEALAARSPQSLQLTDSSIIRAHQHAAGGKKAVRITPSSFSRRIEHQDQRGGRSAGNACTDCAFAGAIVRQDHCADFDRSTQAGSLPRR